ncbi:MAG: PD-(D/E)XK nuclease domain-containing protein [Deltaproteobacteria bacterium]|nr:PD-(D/E)XK nuclease domain-containing protein [Deltaproteobacteria bacterium]
MGQSPKAAKDSFEAALMDRDSEKITELIGSVFASLPAIHHRDDESFYHSVLFGFCRRVSNLVFSETPGAAGTPDLLFYCPNEVYVVLEIKYDKGKKSSDLEAILKKQALKAICAKGYLSPYMDKAKQLIKIGLGVTCMGKCLAIIQDFVRRKDVPDG